MNTPKKYIAQFVERHGGPTELAKQCGMTKGAISKRVSVGSLTDGAYKSFLACAYDEIDYELLLLARASHGAPDEMRTRYYVSSYKKGSEQNRILHQMVDKASPKAQRLLYSILHHIEDDEGNISPQIPISILLNQKEPERIEILRDLLAELDTI